VLGNLGRQQFENARAGGAEDEIGEGGAVHADDVAGLREMVAQVGRGGGIERFEAGGGEPGGEGGFVFRIAIVAAREIDATCARGGRGWKEAAIKFKNPWRRAGERAGEGGLDQGFADELFTATDE